LKRFGEKGRRNTAANKNAPAKTKTAWDRGIDISGKNCLTLKCMLGGGGGGINVKGNTYNFFFAESFTHRMRMPENRHIIEPSPFLKTAQNRPPAKPRMASAGPSFMHNSLIRYQIS
jgi:hypothetical protein